MFFPIALVLCFQSGDALRGVTTDDYFSLSYLSSCSISPSGTYTAWTEGRWDEEEDKRNTDIWIIETKGAENMDDPRKIERLKIWCEDATRATGKIYRHLYIKQKDWNNIGMTPNSFEEIIPIFKDES